MSESKPGAAARRLGPEPDEPSSDRDPASASAEPTQAATSPSLPPLSDVRPMPEDPAADAEEDSEAGDKALPDPAEMGDADDVVNVVLEEGRKRLVERLNDPVLLRRIVRYLIARHEFPRHKADDVTQDTFLRAQRAKKWPAENAPLYPWLRRYANYQRLKYQSASAKHEEREQADEHIDERTVEASPEHENAADIARIARKLAAESLRNAETFEMVRAHAEGVPIAAIAVDADMGEEAAKKRIQRFSEAVKQRWSELGSTAVAICAAILLYLHTLVPHPQPKPNGTGLDTPRPLPVLPAPLSPQAIRAEAMRRCYESAKTRQHWEVCAAWLDRAKDVDPKGESDPDVVELRARIFDAFQGKQPRTEKPLRGLNQLQNP